MTHTHSAYFKLSLDHIQNLMQCKCYVLCREWWQVKSLYMFSKCNYRRPNYTVPSVTTLMLFSSIFNLWLVESEDVEPTDRRGQLYVFPIFFPFKWAAALHILVPKHLLFRLLFPMKRGDSASFSWKAEARLWGRGMPWWTRRGLPHQGEVPSVQQGRRWWKGTRRHLSESLPDPS